VLGRLNSNPTVCAAPPPRGFPADSLKPFFQLLAVAIFLPVPPPLQD